MKLIIQIPCFNEAQTLPLVFEKMPKHIEGITQIEFQIIDDCSTDETVRVAQELGIQHIIKIKGRNRRWLGRAFKLGVESALKNGADILVNTDGDNQYPSDQIAALIQPILNSKADIVIGDREPGKINEFSLFKRFLQKLGSATVGFVTGEQVPDAVSGFRAYSKEALLEINIMTNYTYTVDTLVQALKKGLSVAWHPIDVNPKTRDSRLIKSLFSKVRKSGSNIIRLFTVYEPFKTFIYIGTIFLIPGLFLLLRYAYIFIFIPESGRGHVQSVILGGVLLILAFLMLMLGIIGELLSVNRHLTDEILTKIRKIELSKEDRKS